MLLPWSCRTGFFNACNPVLAPPLAVLLLNHFSGQCRRPFPVERGGAEVGVRVHLPAGRSPGVRRTRQRAAGSYGFYGDARFFVPGFHPGSTKNEETIVGGLKCPYVIKSPGRLCKSKLPGLFRYQRIRNQTVVKSRRILFRPESGSHHTTARYEELLLPG